MTTLSHIANQDSYDAKFSPMIKFLKENIDNYKFFGKYPIEKDMTFTYEYLEDLQDQYIQDPERFVSSGFHDSTFFEYHYQLLKEFVQKSFSEEIKGIKDTH